MKISGRALTATDRGIRNDLINLTNSTGNSQTPMLSPFGYYRFTDVAACETYIITARGKSYSFNQPTQVVNVGEQMTEINFVAYPTESRR